MDRAPVFLELANALRERLAVISDEKLRREQPALQLEKLKDVSAKITSLAAELPSPIDPQLRHFLERCSYDKALAFLEA